MNNGNKDEERNIFVFLKTAKKYRVVHEMSYH